MYYNKIIWIWTERTYQIEAYGIGNEETMNLNHGPGRGEAQYSILLLQLMYLKEIQNIEADCFEYYM
ncbi:hypothetical protein [Clostridium sp. C2-6-12]|uniref:hypothetical protein n=1 Tax=Clostridium sp. C2-6-12 TaxID=2698832 RepID=UPI0019213D5A|nr:hypothetical protein [Clostridium sp. C2-6-12]